MDRIVRNLVVVLLGATTSVIVAVLLVYLEGRTGENLFGYALLGVLPVGAIAAGLLGALGFSVGSLALRLRPSLAVLGVIIAIAAGTVFFVQSAQIGLVMAGRGATADLSSFSQLLGNSLLHSQLRFASASSSSDSAEATTSSAPGSPPMPGLSRDADANVQGMGGGVQNMLAAADPSKIAEKSRPMAQINKIADGVESLNVGQMDGTKLTFAGVQAVGFALGGLVVFGFLRSLSYCQDCSMFLNAKGARTRYFVREHEMKHSVEDVLAMAKKRQLQESIQYLLGKGSGEKTKFAEFSSTIAIKRCPGCESHHLEFKARRKTGATWKDISLLGYTASSMMPIDFAPAKTS
jgi:hypothetical protein